MFLDGLSRILDFHFSGGGGGGGKNPQTPSSWKEERSLARPTDISSRTRISRFEVCDLAQSD